MGFLGANGLLPAIPRVSLSRASPKGALSRAGPRALLSPAPPSSWQTRIGRVSNRASACAKLPGRDPNTQCCCQQRPGSSFFYFLPLSAATYAFTL